MKPLLQTVDLKKYFPQGKRILKAVDGISIEIKEGETLGLVGESGCGKSTLGRTILKLLRPDGGKIFFEGKDVTNLNDKEMKPYRKKMQIIFQDPLGSLNPQMTVGRIIEDPLIIHKIGTKKERRKRVEELLDMVGIGREFINSFPHEFSGGQQQRIGIARALALNPKFIVCDEPVSALDVSIQAQIIDLLEEIQQKMGISYLFIAHNLAVVEHISHKVAVMYLGKIVEYGDVDKIFLNPIHPYTRALLKSVPKIPWDGQKQRFYSLKGELPSPIDLPKGCRFQTRCTEKKAICFEKEPELTEVEKNHFVSCHLVRTYRG